MSDEKSDQKPGPREGASIPEIELDIARTREQFKETLDAIEDKLSVPAHARRLTASVKRRLDDDPAPVVAAAAAGVAGAVAIVAGIVKITRR
jgi:predicted nucleic acid-binding protein